ncbi:MAG: metal-dependent transcriptional regulator [Clostridia bacterium]|nr:metal-dependent transcriptional regulator [Clostridia bacterium]
MASKEILSPSSEDYLETILELSDQNNAVRSVDIANHLGVSKASVNKAMGILREMGLIEQEHYGQVYLTEHGRLHAQDILDRHAMIKRFLTDILHIQEETAELDACRMEHVISDETKTKWLNWLREIL